MKSLLLLLLVFANMGFTNAGNSVQQSNATVPGPSHNASIQDCIIVVSPYSNMVVMH